MTTYTTYTTQNGDTVDLQTNPGCPPMVYLNGVLQSASNYRVVGKSVFFSDDVLKWQPWYAWRPVRVNGKWFWLTKVYRRRKGALFKRYDTWIYGDDFDLLKENQ